MDHHVQEDFSVHQLLLKLLDLLLLCIVAACVTNEGAGVNQFVLLQEGDVLGVRTGVLKLFANVVLSEEHGRLRLALGGSAPLPLGERLLVDAIELLLSAGGCEGRNNGLCNVCLGVLFG